MVKMHKAGDNIFKDLGFSPQEAENLQIRSILMTQIKQYIEKHKLTQKEAAKVFGLTPPRMNRWSWHTCTNNLMQGKINLFGIDMLVNMLVSVGLHVSVSVHSEQIAA